MNIVLADPPTFTVVPDPSSLVAEGQDLVLTAQTKGAPTPDMSWYKIEDNGFETHLTGDRYTLHEGGNITIHVSINLKSWFI